MTERKRYQIFVSSTYEDLKNERAKVMETILNFDCFPAGMERFPAMDVKLFEYIKKIIDDSDYYLLIIGGRYGSVDKSSGKSWTEQEFDYADSKGIPIMVFDHKDFTKLPAYKTDQDDEKRNKLLEFREKAKTGRHINKWSSADNLALNVSNSLRQIFDMQPRIGWVRANTVVSSDSPEDIKSIKVDKYKELATLPIVDTSKKEDTPIKAVSLTKKYKPRMNAFLNFVSFRIEFFSLPTFKERYMIYLAKEFPNIQYRERTLSQAEMGLVDIDSIAWDLSLPLSTIADDPKNYVIDDIIVGELHSKVYVNPYYLYINIPVDTDKGGIINEETLEFDIKRIFNMNELKNTTQIQNVSCIVNHYLKITPENLFKWEVLDKDAFPQIYLNEINTARYSDLHQTQDGIQNTLIREIIKGRDELTDKVSLFVNITSKSTYDDSIIVDFDESYQELFNLALNEVARCFK